MKQTGDAGVNAVSCREALIVFVDETDLRPLRILRRGFRHCFVLVRASHGWIVCDPLAHQLDLISLEDFPRDAIADHFRQRGHTVIATQVIHARRRIALFRPLTCVETVKRVLGIHAAFVITPWQLFSYLTNKDENNQ